MTSRWALTLALAAPALGPAVAAADNLVTESSSGYEGYSAVEELSYEIFVEPDRKRPGHAKVVLRQTLHNSSNEMHDAVSTLGAPPGSRLTGVRVARNGVWHEGFDAEVSARPDQGEREPGQVFAQIIPPEKTGAVGGLEIVVYGIQANATTQVEVELDVPTVVRGKRWELELPPRGRQSAVLKSERRISVRNIPGDDHFWVDGIDSGKDPTIIVDHDEFPLIQWPAHLSAGPTLASNLEYTPDTFGEGGRFRLQVRLGQDKVRTPKHVVLIVDRSTSTSDSLQKDARTLVRALFAQLPAGTTFDAIGFARGASALVEPADAPASVDDPKAVGELDRALAQAARAEGTDLTKALVLAAQRLGKDKAKQAAFVVLTDGMLPTGPGAADLEEDFKIALAGKRRPELIFMVDDPLLLQGGVPGDHPVAQVAARLGARLTLQDFSHAGQDPNTPLLAAPRVLGELQLDLPDGVELDGPLPQGIVAGQFVLIEGTYAGRHPRSLRLRGRLGTKNRAVKAVAHRSARVPEAVAASLNDEVESKLMAEAGFAFPQWYTRNAMQASRVAIERAGRNAAHPKGTLTSDIFLRYLRQRVLPRAHACYRSAMNRAPTLAGRVTFDFELGKGEVMLAALGKTEFNLEDTTFETCLGEAAWAMRIPQSSLDHQVYRVRYPVNFHPPKDAPSREMTRADEALVDLLVRSADILAQ